MIALATWSAAPLALAAPDRQSATSEASSASADSETLLAVSLNGETYNDAALVLRGPDGRVWLSAADLASLRLAMPTTPARAHEGDRYYPLDAFPGLSWRIDEPTQTLVIKAPANLFDRIRLDGVHTDYVPAPPSPLGGFLNYDTFLQNDGHRMSASALLEASVFGRAGAAVTRYIERYEDHAERNVRLESTWTVDHPESAASLRVGDSISGASRWWGGAVRFGGLQWASNFATRPGLVTLPLPSIGGESAVPSTLELYVNDSLRLRQNVPSGPFTVTDVPIVTGDGEIRLVVRDMMGREQVITQSYYASPRLLRPGLHEYSLEAGAIRENFGLASNDYGRALLVATDRVGLTERFTGEIHAEALMDQQTAGIAGGLLLPRIGVLSAALAGSHDGGGTGHLVSLGFERTSQRLTFGATAQLASAAFTRIGLLPGESVPRLMSQIFANVPLGRRGSLSLIGARQAFRDRAPIELLSARYGVDLRDIGYLSCSALRSLGTQRDTLVSLNFTRSLGGSRNASLSVNTQGSGTFGQIQLQQSPPAGTGMGYRLRANGGEAKGLYGDLEYQNEVGAYEIEAEQLAGSLVARAGVSGGIAMLGGRAFASRQIEGSFAVAKVGDEPNVRIYRDNQVVAQTDARGYAILPGLRPYQDNLIGIEQSDLPLDVEVTALEEQAVPHYRSGVLLTFPVTHAYGAVLTVMQENGEPLPAGAMVRAVGRDTEAAPVGMRGEVYVTQLSDRNHLRATWDGHTCEFDAPFTRSDDPLPHFGPFTCRSVVR